MKNEFVLINGEKFAPENAKISVFDRGFLFGDAIYEVTRSYQGVLFQLEAHIERLLRSANRIQMDLGMTSAEIQKELVEAAAQCDRDVYIRIQISRGSGVIGLDPRLASVPTRVVYVKPFTPFAAEYYENGVKIVVSSVERNTRKGMDPNIKSGNYLNNIMALQQGLAADAHEVLLLNSRGEIQEATTSNIFMVKQGKLITPPLTADILSGITRALILKIARREGVEVEERMIQVDELLKADEVFLTSSTREIMPVSRVDTQGVNSQEFRIGSLTRKLIVLYRQLIQSYVEERSRG